MGPGIQWGLAEFVKRLGAGREDLPPVAYSVQPVANVGDLSALSTPMVPPMALYGCLADTTALEYATAIVRSKAEGGTLVTDVIVIPSAASEINMVLELFGAEPGTFAAVNTALPQQMGLVDTKAVVVGGADSANPASVVVPTSASGVLNSLPVPMEFFIPPGSQVRFVSETQGKDFTFTCLVREWHEPRPSA